MHGYLCTFSRDPHSRQSQTSELGKSRLESPERYDKRHGRKAVSSGVFLYIPLKCVRYLSEGVLARARGFLPRPPLGESKLFDRFCKFFDRYSVHLSSGLPDPPGGDIVRTENGTAPRILKVPSFTANPAFYREEESQEGTNIDISINTSRHFCSQAFSLQSQSILPPSAVFLLAGPPMPMYDFLSECYVRVPLLGGLTERGEWDPPKNLGNCVRLLRSDRPRKRGTGRACMASDLGAAECPLQKPRTGFLIRNLRIH